MASVTWEYRIVTGQNALTEASLNSLGAEGWELVSVASHVRNSELYGEVAELLCVFKRQLQTEQAQPDLGVF